MRLGWFASVLQACKSPTAASQRTGVRAPRSQDALASAPLRARHLGAPQTPNNTVCENKNSRSIGGFRTGIVVGFDGTARDPRGTAASRVKGNSVTNNDVGIYMLDSRNWLVEANRVFGNSDVSTAAPDGGIGVFESSMPGGGSNRLIKNDARGNDGLDCEDGTTGSGTGGTGNTWTGNRGTDDAPPAICAPLARQLIDATPRAGRRCARPESCREPPSRP